MPSRPPAPFLALSLAVLLSACGGASPGASVPGEASSGGEPSQAAESEPVGGEPTPGTTLTACELVAPADIEAALGLDPGTVAEGEHRETPNVLSPGNNECRYDDEWGGLVVLVTPEDGVNVWDAVVVCCGEDATPIENVGDGALWFPDNDRGYFIKGPVLIVVQFTHLTVEADWMGAHVAVGTAAIAKI